jgi:hypothetical protein
MIAQMEYRHCEAFNGIFRVHGPEIKTARNRKRYLACRLQDRSGELPAYGWLDRSIGDTELAHMALVNVRGRLRRFGEQWIADLEEVYVRTEPVERPLEVIPPTYCPIPAGLDRLEYLCNNLTVVPLREMLLTVLNDDRVILPFLSLPASRRNHHSHPSGLLVHSLECAEFVAHYRGLPDDIIEIGIVAALLHDIGKVRTISSDGNGTMIGRVLGHDLLTLELLAESLSHLDRHWPDGGTALRYLLCWKLQKRSGSKPLMVISELIQAADRISSGIDNEKALFRDMPAWRQYVADETGRRAWRPRAVFL